MGLSKPFTYYTRIGSRGAANSFAHLAWPAWIAHTIATWGMVHGVQPLEEILPSHCHIW